VEKMSMCNISPTCEGIGVLPNYCLLGCGSYLALLQTLQLVTTSLATFDMFGKWKFPRICFAFVLVFAPY